MNRRLKTSKGQALVLVTLGLLAMCGLMGLVVDLGWSFYLKKAAQAAADAGALAAVQETKIHMNGNFSVFTCASWPGACQPAQKDCASVATMPLANGCSYATSNGFTSAGTQKVSIQANDNTSLPTTLTGTYSSKTIAYWVTVRVSQTVPQLFSAVIGNPTGVISASATAAVIATVVPGQFIALNQPGNCINGSNCGVDFVLGGGDQVVAPGGVIISSTCNGSNQVGCGNSPTGSGNNYATNTGNGNGSQCVSTGTNCTSNGSPVEIQTGGQVDHTQHFAPATTTIGSSAAQDPLLHEGQPPLVTPSSPVGTCGISGGTINGSSGNNPPLVLGPFQYYSYHTTSPTNTTPVLDGLPITVTGNVQFSTSGTCTNNGIPALPVAGASQGAFPVFTFYGGLSLSGSQANVNFGAGQYVMVGATSGGSAFTLGTNGGPQITGDSTTGTMFISTAPGYSPELTTQMNALTGNGTSLTSSLSQVSLLQGDMSFNGGSKASVNLTGVSQNSTLLPTALDQYNGILIWQDRRNSTSEYTEPTTGTPPVTTRTITTPATPSQLTANLVTATSPQFTFGSSPNFVLNGVLYQPQGRG